MRGGGVLSGLDRVVAREVQGVDMAVGILPEDAVYLDAEALLDALHHDVVRGLGHDAPDAVRRGADDLLGVLDPVGELRAVVHAGHLDRADARAGVRPPYVIGRRADDSLEPAAVGVLGGAAGRRARLGSRGAAALGHGVIPLLCAPHVGVLLGGLQRGRAGGRAEMAVGEDVLAPCRTAEAVGETERRHEVRAGLEALVRDVPRVGADVGVLDVDRAAVGVEVAERPSRVAVVHELADDAVALHLVVGRGLTGLPDVPAALHGQIARVVVDADVLDLAASSAGRVVLGEPLVDVGVESLEVHASPPLPCIRPGARASPRSGSRRCRPPAASSHRSSIPPSVVGRAPGAHRAIYR